MPGSATAVEQIGHPRLRVRTQAGRALERVCVTFPFGQRDEPAGQEGLAHLVEHLVHCRGDGGSSDFFARLAHRGAIANAYTGADYLQFWVSLPPESVAEWAVLFARQLSDPEWSRQTVIREHAVIRAEVTSKVTAHPHRGFSFDQLRSALFADHANSHPGFLDNPGLLDLGDDDLVSRYRSILDPASMLVTAVGPLAPDAVADAVEQILPEVLAGSGLRRARRPAVLAAPATRTVDRAEVSPYGVAITFPLLRIENTVSQLAAELITAAMLGQGRGAMLTPDRPAGASLTARIGFGGDPNEDSGPSCLTVESIVRAPAERCWLAEALTRFLADPVLSQAELVRARNYVLSGSYLRFEDPLQYARSSAWLALWLESTIGDYLSALDAVDERAVAGVLASLGRHGGAQVWL